MNSIEDKLNDKSLVRFSFSLNILARLTKISAFFCFKFVKSSSIFADVKDIRWVFFKSSILFSRQVCRLWDSKCSSSRSSKLSRKQTSKGSSGKKFQYKYYVFHFQGCIPTKFLKHEQLYLEIQY